ncbi:MAG: DUF255 domain-containing protein [Candidatus Obscuribacterales bacterium]|nr:DUF255 domain-containing protein [Candidatus Obscuribacterales bacterium]
MGLPDRLQTTLIPDWLIGLTAVFILLRTVIGIAETLNPPLIVDRVHWRNAEEGIKEAIEKKKCALFYFSLKKCPACTRLKSSSFSDKQLSSIIEDRFVPIQIREYRKSADGDFRPYENKRLGKLYKYYYSYPEVSVVAPIMLRTDRQIGYTGMQEAYGLDRTELVKLILKGADWQPSPDSPGQVHWLNLEAASQSESDKLPLYFFMKAHDFHCDRTRKDIFNDDDISKLVNENYLPAMVVDHSLVPRKNSREEDRLIEKYDIREFPCTVVADRQGNQPMYLYGFPGKDTCQGFIERAVKKLGNKSLKE